MTSISNVITQTGPIKLDNYKVDKSILSFSIPSKTIQWNTFLGYKKESIDNFIHIRTEHGLDILCPERYQILTSQGLKNVKDLQLGDLTYVPLGWHPNSQEVSGTYGYGVFFNPTKRPTQMHNILLDEFLGFCSEFEVDLNHTKFQQDRTIPHIQFNVNPFELNKANLGKFLGGVFDTWGTFNTSLKCYEIVFEEREFLETIQLLLLSLGVVSKIVRRITDTTKLYSLIVSKYYMYKINTLLKGALIEKHKYIPERVMPQNYTTSSVIYCEEVSVRYTIPCLKSELFVLNGIVVCEP